MYPSSLVSRPHTIDYHADDKEMFLHLDKMMRGAPHPQNVLTDVDVDPYAVAPWNLPPNMLYFINSDYDISLGEKGIKAAEGGYWYSRPWTQSLTMGRVTTKEFYRGKAPHGEKTDWVMKEYTTDKFLGSRSLCKVFKHNDGNHTEERQQAVADDADGEFVQAMLLEMLEEEENVSGFQSLPNMSQVLSINKRGPPVISASHLQNLRPPNYVWVPGDEDDFLEERDLVGSASFSSLSSEKTWVSSMTLNDDYFDPEALLRELTPSIQDTTNKQNVDRCRATGSASQGSHQVHIQPPPSGSLGGSVSSSSSNNNKNPLMMKTVVSASMPSIHIGVLNHTHPHTAASVKELPNKKIVGRITKLVKKYFCFM